MSLIVVKQVQALFKTYKLMNKNTLILDTMRDISDKVRQRVDWEKKNLKRNKRQFSQDCGVTRSTLDNVLSLKKGLNLVTAINVLYESGYKIKIEPI